MPNPIDLEFREMIAKRIAHTKALAHEKGIDENDVRQIFQPLREVEYLEIPVTGSYKVEGREWFNLAVSKIEEAERNGKSLRFTWHSGSSVFTPKEFRLGAIPYQKPFKYADNPMRCLGNWIERI